MLSGQMALKGLRRRQGGGEAPPQCQMTRGRRRGSPDEMERFAPV
jgi:hypothetical protein